VSETIVETRQYITLKLGDELFAIDVGQVREVLEVTDITKVPTAPEYMRGVVNVRGKAVPVVDLRRKFGLPTAAATVNSRILVMELDLDGELVIVGGIADSVHEVIEIEPAQIDPPPTIAMRWRTDLISGMARRGDDFIIVLDIHAAFALDVAALTNVETDAVPAEDVAA
jgi:purine-binding chemotaxis protein CheW